MTDHSTENAPQTTDINSPKDELKVDAYRGWLAGLKKQVDDGTMTFTDFSNIVSEKIFARDQQLKRQSTLRKAYEEQVKTDKLVELASEEAFNEHLDRLAASGENYGLLLIDLDHFGDINTKFGHSGGNQALIKVADRLSNTIRAGEKDDSSRARDEIYRLHGDELAVLIPNLTPDIDGKKTLKAIAERMKASLEDPLAIKHDGKDILLPTTVSIGGAVLKQGTPEGLKDLVDKKALYQAKADGRNRSFILNYDKPINSIHQKT